MKNIAVSVFTVFITLLSINTLAQQCRWARGSEGLLYDRSRTSIASDAAGNSYVTGCYVDSISFGSNILYSVVPNSVNIFLVKYDPAGVVLWAKTFGGQMLDIPSSVTTDAWGHVYLLGSFSSPSIAFGSYTLVNSSGTDFYLVKFDSAGNTLWATTQIPSVSGDPYEWNFPAFVRTDNMGGVVVSGTYRSTLHFPGTSITNVAGEGGGYVARYDTAGHFLWARSSAGYINCYGTAVATDNAGNVYAAGYIAPVLPASGFYMTITFDTVNVTVPIGTFLYLVKYDVSGNQVSFKLIGNGYGGNVAGMATDGEGNLYMTGYIDGDPLGPFLFDTIALNDTGFGVEQFFIVKYNIAGHALWARSTSGDTANISLAITVDKDGNAVIAGPSFIKKYTTGGDVSWSIDLTSHIGMLPFSLTQDNAGDIFAAGSYWDTLTFDTCSIVALPVGAVRQVFALKFQDLTEQASVLQRPAGDMLLFPNPSDGELNIRSDGQDIKKILISDITGRIVYSGTATAAQIMKIDISNLPPGVYIARINDNCVRKFVKGR